MTIDQNRESAITRRRSALAYLASGGILIGGVATYLVVLYVMVDTQNVNFFPVFVGAITMPMSVLVFANRAAPQARVPSWAIVFTAIVGGLIRDRRRSARVRHPAPTWLATDGARRRR